MFVDVLTRPRLTRTIVAVCQPFLSPCEQSIVLGKAAATVAKVIISQQMIPL